MPKQIDVFVVIDGQVAMALHDGDQVALPLTKAHDAACAAALAEALTHVVGKREEHVDDEREPDPAPRPRLMLVKSDD